MSALDIVLENFREAGWTTAARESVGGGRSVNPTRVDIVRGNECFSLLAYAWKITHEGKGRTGVNYRIQTTRSHNDDLYVEEGRQTVGFGVDADRQVIAVFDGWTKRATGRSSSVHIKRATLESAAADGFAEQVPRWDGRAAARYSEVDRLLQWISEQQPTRTAAVQPLDYVISDDRTKTTVVADLWDSAPAASLRRGDRLVLASRDGSGLLDTAIWQISALTVETVIREGRNPRRKVTFSCRRYGQVTNTPKTYLAGLTPREPV